MDFARDGNGELVGVRNTRSNGSCLARDRDRRNGAECPRQLRASRRGGPALRRWLVLFALLAGTARIFALSTPAQGALAAGGHHVLALRADGTVWSWGANDTGQLGTNDGLARANPTPVAGLDSVAAISAGYGHSLALKADGTVWAWGDNSSAQLGDGTQLNRPLPVQIPGLTGVVAIAGGRLHSLALQADGTLWAWGADIFRQLGDGGFMTQLRPIRITMPGPVARIVASDYASAAVLADGSAWRWGYGGSQALPSASVPTRVADLPPVTEIALGFGHLVARATSGDLWVVGANDRGQLGVGNSDSSAVPHPNGLACATALAVNDSTNYALLADGSLRAWGRNIFGALGDGTKTNRLAPVSTGGAGHYVAIAAGEYFGVALDDAGGVWQWGRNDAGQSGDGASQQLARLAQMPKLDHLLGVSLTAKSGAVLKSDGTVWTLSGDAVPDLAGIVALAIGSAHSAALKSDGTVWTWGANESGQLGNGSSTYSATPVAVPAAGGAVAVDVGLDHTMMLKNDGHVWSWGGNNNYQLGDGTKVSRPTPVWSTVASEAVGIASGYGYSVAIKPDGTVVRWGLNGTTVIPGLGGIVGVSAGNNHALALKSDGTVWGWGDNTYGQLGLGNAGGYYTSGVQVPGLSDIVEVAAGATHSVARRNDGQVFAWGQNGKGALGDGSTNNRFNPVAVTPSIAARSIAAGDEVTALVGADGTLWAAGDGAVFNWDELALRKAAISVVAAAADSDGDGMRDAWELAQFGSLARNGVMDADGDALTDIRESLVGTDPRMADTDGDGKVDSADVAPLDYYDGVVPTLAIVAGDNQVAAPGEFTPLSLDVGIWNRTGTAPLVNAPVTFAVAAGGGKLAAAIGGALSDTLTLRSDGDGSTQAFYQQPAASGVSSTIDVSAGQAWVHFHSTSASAGEGPDGDQDGLPDSWEMRYFATLDFGPADQFNDMDRTLLEYYEQRAAPRWMVPVVADGLRAWYQAGALYFTDPMSGGVKIWADLSGNGFHLRQDAATLQPFAYASELGERFMFFSEGQKLSTAIAEILGGTADFTILVTLRPDFPARPVREIAKFGDGDSDGFSLVATNESVALKWVDAVSNTAQGNSPHWDLTLGTTQQFTVVKSGTIQTLYRNGAPVSSDAVIGVPQFSPGEFAIGGTFDGAIYEIQIYDRALPVAQREAAEDALLQRSQLSDSDGNGLPDRWERRNFDHIGVNPDADEDSDGLANRDEYVFDSNPVLADSDGDGYVDGQEVALGTDVLDPLSKGVAQLTWIARITDVTNDTVSGYYAPGLSSWLSSSPVYRKFSWQLVRTGGATGNGVFSFSAELNADLTSWTLTNNTAGLSGMYGAGTFWSYVPQGTTTVTSLPFAWEGPSGFGGVRVESIAAALYRGGSVNLAEVAWTETWPGLDDEGNPLNYTNAITASLSLPQTPIPILIPGRVVVGSWGVGEPFANRNLLGEQKAEYLLLVPEGSQEVYRWMEIFTPEDGTDVEFAMKEWTSSDSPRNPAFSLVCPRNGNSGVRLFTVDLGVDADRDGEVTSSASDRTDPAHPFRFWLNDDIDRGHTVDGSDFEQDDISPTEAAVNNWVEDWKYNTVQSRRDLEDFSRIVVFTSSLSDAFRNGDLYLGLKWTDTVGTPSIKLYKQYDATGSTSYLTDDYQASVQLPENAILNQRYPNDDVLSMSAHTVVTPGDLFVLPQGLWIGTTGDIKRSLLFEGCTAGKGQLKLVILKRDGSNYTEIGDGPGVWLDLKNIKDMYEHWTVGQGPVPYGGGAPSALSRASSFTYTAQSPEEAKYILYVHGWNMEQWEKERFAETAYKRLYWQGYKGRFGLFSWPTTNGFDGTASAIKDSTNYDRGEFSAWRSASLLEQKLAQLNGQYPSQVYLLAHSMGNVVAGEALRRAGQDGLGVIVRTYVASQGALPVHCYNGSLPDNLDADVPASGIVRAFDGGWPQTANAYKSWLAANSAAVAKRVNFFNINDYALWRDIWQLNQWLKPDHPDFRPNPPDPQRTYYYLDDINQPPTQDGFGWLRPGGQQVDPTDRPYLNNTWYAILRLGNTADVKDRYEIMAMASESRSKALGATSVNEGLDASLWLGSVWPADPSGDARPYSRHKWHSAEFRSTNMLQKGYWQALLGPQGFNIITPP